MHIREWVNARKRPMAEFIRTTYSAEKKRGIAKRIGRFQIDVVRDVGETAAFRACTDTEKGQAREWWGGVQTKLGARQKVAEAKARSQRLGTASNALQAAVDGACAALAAGMAEHPEEMWRHVSRLSKALRKAGVSKPASQENLLAERPVHPFSQPRECLFPMSVEIG